MRDRPIGLIDDVLYADRDGFEMGPQAFDVREAAANPRCRFPTGGVGAFKRGIGCLLSGTPWDFYFNQCAGAICTLAGIGTIMPGLEHNRDRLRRVPGLVPPRSEIRRIQDASHSAGRADSEPIRRHVRISDRNRYPYCRDYGANA